MVKGSADAEPLENLEYKNHLVPRPTLRFHSQQKEEAVLALEHVKLDLLI